MQTDIPQGGPSATLRPTELLLREHRQIERVLLCLERMAARCETDGKLERERALEAIDFIRTYADACHHGKEEAQLFPAMERHGIPAHAGPTAVMRHEHVEGRGQVVQMADAVEEASRGEAPGVARFVASARAFALLLRDHIAKEDQVLFHMADSVVPPNVQAELLTGFAAFEAQDCRADVHTHYGGVADGLCEHYGVTPEDVADAAPGGFGCLGH